MKVPFHNIHHSSVPSPTHGQEGAIGETSPVLTAILASLETLEKLGLNHPEVGSHRRWHALAQELDT